MRSGVTMVLEKPASLDVVMREVHGAFEQATASLEQFQRKAAAQEALERLPERHHAVLKELIECRPHKQIANRLDIALRTVEKRKKEIFELLSVGTFTEMLALVHLADDAHSPLAKPHWQFAQAGQASTMN
jgi:FixJ family two-component response regulator